MPFLVHKNVGETPLQALERFRKNQVARGDASFADIPMTYAGRLDPMAEGELLILAGEECKRKSDYLGLDKEYEMEAVFGIETDTYDSLGLAMLSSRADPEKILVSETKEPLSFRQKYPPYSSKTYGGVALHELARKGELPADDEMPERDVTIYSIREIGRKTYEPRELEKRILSDLALLHQGLDFRQKEIVERWKTVLDDADSKGLAFPSVKVAVSCSAGTYMRSLAYRMGRESGTGAFALSIKRTRIIMPA